jgi:hypothetical protein
MSRETKEKVGEYTHKQPKDECCENCQCCISYVIAGSVGFRSANIEVFECHRNPPKAKQYDFREFPRMLHKDWCYEWKSRNV